VWIASASGNTVGGTAAGAGNVIAGNSGRGVYVSQPTATGNAIQANAIFGNGNLGIDLDPNGVSPNDAGDGDAGANSLQNYPVLASAATNGASVRVQGTLNSTPSTTYRIELFANAAGDPSGHGEGESYLGALDVTSDPSGDASFSWIQSASVPVGSFVTATATNLTSGDTSEFAQHVTAAAAGVVVVPVTGLTTSEAGGADAFSVVLASPPTAAVTVGLASADPSEGLLSASSLTFAPASWNVPQTVTVTGVDDAIDDGDVAFAVLTAPAVSADALYDGFDPADVAVTNVDDDDAAANLPPINTVPGAQTVSANSVLVFLAAGGNRVSVNDPDAGGNPLQVTLTAGNGTLTLAQTSGLTFSSGDGSADASMTFTGSIGAVNQALDGLSFAPNATFTGAASLMLTTDDQGNTGSGGAQRDTDTVPITVTARNSGPRADAGGPYAIAVGDPLVLDGSGSSDADGDPLAYAWDLDADSVYGDVTGVSPTVSWATLARLGITTAGTYTIGLRVDDGNGGAAADSAAFTVEVLEVNAAPPPASAEDPGTGGSAAPTDGDGRTVSEETAGRSRVDARSGSAQSAEGTRVEVTAPESDLASPQLRAERLGAKLLVLELPDLDQPASVPSTTWAFDAFATSRALVDVVRDLSVPVRLFSFSTAWVFGFCALTSVRRRRAYVVDGVARSSFLDVFDRAGGAPQFRLRFDAGPIWSRGRRRRKRGGTWRPVDTPAGRGYVEASRLADAATVVDGGLA